MAELFLVPLPTRPAPIPARSTAELGDQEAREAALDIQRSWIVEAPAGSGKTGLLIQRYLKLLAYADIHRPGEVLVLTFTRKADGELRARVLEQLTAAFHEQPLSSDAASFERETRALAEAVLRRDRALRWRLLDTPSQLNIRTIDSFCAELAASMPLLSGAGRLQPIDDAYPLYDRAAERTLGHLGGPDIVLNDALRTLLAHRDAQVADCLRLLAGMLAQREQWSELIPLDAPNLTDEYLDTAVRPRLEQTLQLIVTDGLQQAAEALGSDNLTQLAHFATRLGTEPGYGEAANPLTGCANLPGTLPRDASFAPQWKAVVDLLLTDRGDWRKKPTAHNLKVSLPKADAQWLADFLRSLQSREDRTHPHLRATLAAVRKLPAAHYPDDQWQVVKALCRILSCALVELRELFTQRAQCDFTEIALTARSLLRPSPSESGHSVPDILSTTVSTLSHLLVDEMQDTSSSQYQLLEAVTGFWDGFSQTVFLVGDPKQSIYAFRQARVERFLRTMNTGRLGDLPLQPLRLTANFRSQAALVDAFNATFQAIFPAPIAVADALEATASVPFTAATATRQTTTTPALRWHALSATAPAARARLDPEATDLGQPQQIRGLIERFLEDWEMRSSASEQTPRPPKVAVLARNRAHLAPIIQEFHTDRGRGPLPFRAVDVEALRERPEILDLLALTRALLHPGDRVAWLAVLRSPVCGLTLADLLTLTGEGPDADPAATVLSLVHGRRHLLSPDGQWVLNKVWPTLETALNTLGSTPFSTHIQRTWRSVGADAPLSPDQYTNCLRFLDLLRQLESGPDPISLPLLSRKLEKLYAEPISTDAPVELMTIHKAKGLEWDLVLVPSLESGSGSGNEPLLRWLELDNPDTDGDFLLAPIQSKGTDASALSAWLRGGEYGREIAEAQRLLYVACTRAREELHLFASVETKADGSLCAPRAKTSLLNAAWPIAGPLLQAQLSTRSAASLIPFPNTPQQAESIALAAAAAAENVVSSEDLPEAAPAKVHRLPADFDPLARSVLQGPPLLPYTASSELRRSAAFLRPEGSFAARAFGNTVHRFLQFLTEQLAAGTSLPAAQAALTTWQPRLYAALRSEGLSQVVATRETQTALAALTTTLADPEGTWILGARPQAHTEAPFTTESSSGSSLRADRTFLAGPTALSDAEPTHLWIVDYKTTDLGGRDRAAFLAAQKTKYIPQMRAYAHAAALAGHPPERIVLALYFPLLPALVSWPAEVSIL